MEHKEKLLGETDEAEFNGKEKGFQDGKSSSGSEKAAYFEMLRLWVNQTMLHQNASQSFPYYLMANSPQIFTHPGSQSMAPLVTDRTQRDEGE